MSEDTQSTSDDRPSLRPQTTMRLGGGAGGRGGGQRPRDSPISSQAGAPGPQGQSSGPSTPTGRPASSPRSPPPEDDDDKDGKDEEETHLENSWVLWFDRRQGSNRAKDHNSAKQVYESGLRIVGEFSSVETFWRYFNNMNPPHELENGSNYHLFKTGIKPMWEDQQNANGGKWSYQLKRGNNDIDIVWQNMVLAAIGEQLDEDDDVCGVVLARRAGGDRIAVWNRNGQNKEAVKFLGERMKKVLVDSVRDKGELEYSLHQASIETHASYANASVVEKIPFNK